MRPTYYFYKKQSFVIKSELKKAKIKQKDIAEELKVSPQYINAMINGKKPISNQLKALLERVLYCKLTRQKEDKKKDIKGAWDW